MPILNVKIDEIGESGITPGIVRIETNDTLAEILVPGYLNSVAKQFNFSEADLAAVTTKPTPNSRTTTVGWFEFAYAANTGWSLEPTAQPGSVQLPTIAGRIAVFMDAFGTIGMEANPATHETDINAGFNGSGGDLVSFAPTLNQGFFRIRAQDAGGNFITTLSNDPLSQSTVYLLPDVSNTNSRVLAAAGTAPFVDGNFAVAVGTNGRMKDSGAKILSGVTAPWAGGSTVTRFLVTGMLVGSPGACNIVSSTNPAYIVYAVPDAGGLNVTFSTDPGANTVISYNYTSAPQV